MTARTIQLDITILGREFKVACKENEREELSEAVALLDRRMREIRDAGKVTGTDRIAVMNNGRLQQVGTPRVLYESPADSFVADFLGESNFLPVAGDKSVVAMVRPESVRVGDAAASCPNKMSGVVKEVTYAGSTMKLHIAVTPDLTLVASLQSAATAVGSTVTAGWMPEDIRLFPADGSQVQTST